MNDYDPLIRRNRKMSRGGCCEQAAGNAAVGVSADPRLSLAMSADDLIVLGPSQGIGHGTVREALLGDWLSAAFQTPVHVSTYTGDTGGDHRWRSRRRT